MSRWLSKFNSFIRSWIKERKGNASIFTLAIAVAASMSGYYFMKLSVVTTPEKERVVHFYNAYQMARSVQGQFVNMMKDKGITDANFRDQDGNLRFTKEEFEKLIKYDSGHEFTLTNLFQRKWLVANQRDATAERLLGGRRNYDINNSKIKVAFNMVIDEYDQNGNVIKKVNEIRYFVNLAGDENPFDNAPYDEGMPFYYLVSFVDEDAGLREEHVTLKTAEGIKYDGILDSIEGAEPSPVLTVILPGDYRQNSNNAAEE
ncbi:MAG: hypothetical protein ACON35_05575 [Candidatus Marinamargulisbacteria bacterium]